MKTLESQSDSILAYAKKPWMAEANRKRALQIDYTGEKFGILTCIGRGNKVGNRWLWKVKCECGNEKQAQAGNMQRSKSCGCLTNQIISEHQTRHGRTDSPTWISWKSMLDRIKPSHKSHKHYSDRGITMCEEWVVFENFYADMGDRPEKHTLDRIDNDLGYFPGNCRWATLKTQARNRTSNILASINNQTKTVAEHCENNKIRRDVFDSRIRFGWALADAISRPVKRQKNNRKPLL